MSDDLTNVPRRLRRYYRHGEPVPEGEERNGDSNPVKEGENHEENEPWMNAPPASAASAQRRRGNERRENARAPAPPASPSSANQNANATPKQGLFSRILHRESKPVVTPMDHALGLHDKEKFVEQTPRGSERALRHAPPAPAPSQPANSSNAARADIQKTLQELKSLAKTNTSEDKPSVSLTSFHFTPAGEAPRVPEPNERVAQYPPEKTTENLSPRERAEQRRQGRGNASAPANTSSTPSPSTSPSRAPGKMANENQAAHIRRRMGQLVDNERMDKEDEPISRNSSAEMKDDEDFKSLFSDARGKSKDAEKKKKKASADDDMSLDDDDNAELELFEDDK